MENPSVVGAYETEKTLENTEGAKQIKIEDLVKIFCGWKKRISIDALVKPDEKRRRVVFIVPNAPGGVFVAHRYKVLSKIQAGMQVIDMMWLEVNSCLRPLAKASHINALETLSAHFI
mmetsp:Transcript_11992/g.16612  ORF Transcript_11992/g.16612 Transcript_11992/m.16612 type:complete len:118 (+) Transcript_11992:234-587(+)